MKTRTLKELYLIVLDAIENNKHEYANFSGICRVNLELLTDNLITHNEYWKFKKHLKKNKPTARNKFKSFYEEDLFQPNNLYWWGWMSDSPRYIDVRVRFLKAVIATLK